MIPGVNTKGSMNTLRNTLAVNTASTNHTKNHNTFQTTPGSLLNDNNNNDTLPGLEQDDL